MFLCNNQLKKIMNIYKPWSNMKIMMLFHDFDIKISMLFHDFDVLGSVIP